MFCTLPGPGVVSVNLALHLVCSFTSSSVSEWSVCEVCLSKHSPVMFTHQHGKGGANWIVYSVIHGLTDKRVHTARWMALVFCTAVYPLL